MSRHRIVRSMNYEDEFYDDDEDLYSRSVEDNYCISPSTAAQFTWNREKNVNFAAYMGEEQVINEEEEEDTEEESSISRHDSESASLARLQLSDVEQAQLNSCLEEVRNIVGDAVSEAQMIDVIIKNKYDLEASLNQLLCHKDAPKPQREPRQRRNRSQDDIDNLELDNLLAEIQGVESAADLHVFSQGGLRFSNTFFQSGEISKNIDAGDDSQVLSKDFGAILLLDKTLLTKDSPHMPLQKRNLDSSSLMVPNQVSATDSFNSDSGSESFTGTITSKSDSLALAQSTLRSSTVIENIPPKDNDFCSLQSSAALQVSVNSQMNAPKSLLNLVKMSPNSSVSAEKASVSLADKFKSQCGTTDSVLANLVKQPKPSTLPAKLSAISVDKSKSSQGTSLSLSELVKQSNEPSQSSAPSRDFPLNTVKSSIQNISISLAELVKQHKGTNAAAGGSHSSHRGLAISQSQKVSEGMANLSALVAQHSAEKKSLLNQPSSDSILISLTQKAEGGTESNTQTVPTVVKNQSVSSTSSLSDLAKAYSQSEKNSKISLSQLAQQHRQSTSLSESSFLANATKPSATSLLKTLTLEESENPAVVHGARDHIALESILKNPKLDNMNSPPSLSLSSCLKSGKAAVKTSKAHLVSVQPKNVGHLEDFDDYVEPDLGEIFPQKQHEDLALEIEPSLLSPVSCLGLVLCYVRRKRKPDTSVSELCRNIKYPKFSCDSQVSGQDMYIETVYPEIKAFDFASPSPDDIVKSRQKQAFTRPDKEYQV